MSSNKILFKSSFRTQHALKSFTSTVAAYRTEFQLTFHVSDLKRDINYIKYYTFLTR
jgi:hypothetical protein